MITILTAASLMAADPDAAMKAELSRLDAAIFHHAFVDCDTKAMRKIFADDFEFYHDQGGLTATSGDQFVAKTEKGCAKKPKDMPPPMERILHPETVTFEKLGNSHVMQMGRHDFTELQSDGSYKLVAKARFIHLWKRTEDGGFVLSREISHDHRPPE